jgi:cytosine/adenosine deaminase-related metal-dependent hydrolase
LTPLAGGGTRFLEDAVVIVDEAGRIAAVDEAGEAGAAVDLRPLLLLPGMVDLHAHLPQLPAAGLGGGLDC